MNRSEQIAHLGDWHWDGDRRSQDDGDVPGLKDDCCLNKREVSANERFEEMPDRFCTDSGSARMGARKNSIGEFRARDRDVSRLRICTRAERLAGGVAQLDAQRTEVTGS